MKKRLIIQVFAIVGIFAIFSSYANAAAGVANGFRLSPVRVDVSVEKGHSVTENLYLTNVNNYKITARAVINEFSASSDESGSPAVILDNSRPTPPNSFKSITATIPDITIDAGQTVTVPVTIAIPKNANSGGYYGAVRFTSANSANGQSVTLSASVGTIFLITVPGKLTEQLQLVDFSAAKNGSTASFFSNSKNLQIVTRVHNTGNIHLAPNGKIDITNSGGQIVETINFNNVTPRGEVLPNTIRKYSYNIQKQDLFGKYSAIAYLGYGTSGQVMTIKTSFWVIPFWLIIVSGAVILSLIGGIGYVVMRRRHAPRHKAHIKK
jgi:hypothetical protein